jgi:NADH-ubiquinone oxidoreductase chain 5
LPAAIAAPTPVSALVHSSTLVTAGVYLLIRINLIIIEINIRYILLLIGIITIIIAGITAIIEIDIKKIIALSTLSQLGIIILILGIGNPILSFFHLLSHAFFKAMLFICAGIIIHNIKDYQDIRKIGIRYNNLNLCISIIIIANIRLCGLPFLRGFYSKDLIIEIIIIKGKNLFLFYFMIIGTILTVLYSCRLNFLVRVNFLKLESLFFISENSIFILIGIIFLLPFSIIGGIIIS